MANGEYKDSAGFMSRLGEDDGEDETTKIFVSASADQPEGQIGQYF